MPETKRPLKVFLSYASQDKPVVRELSGRLASEGWIDPWVDEKKLLPGQDWRTKIEEAVETSDIVIICLSSNSVTKEGFVQKELRYAREIAFEKPDETIFLVPLRLDDCTVPRGLRFYQWGDYFGEQADETYSALLESLKVRYEQKLRIEEELARQEKEKRKREAAEKVAREEAERKAAEKAESEKAEKATREKLERQIAEKDRREKAEREAAEKAAREKAKREAAQKAKREKVEHQAARKAALTKMLNKSFTALKSTLPKAKPILRIAGIIGIFIILFWFGSWAMPRLSALMPTENARETSLPSPTNTLLGLSETQAPTLTFASLPSSSTQTSAPESNVLLSNETPVPNGYEIGYMQGNGRNLDLYVANADGNLSKVVGEFDSLNGRFAVLNNGQFIAKSKDGIIYYINVLTGEETSLFSSVYQREYDNLAWSPDAKYLLMVVQGRDQTVNYYTVYGDYWAKTYILNLETSSLVEILNRTGSHLIKNIHWSPDNKTVAYWESGDIFLLNPETKQMKNITTSGIVSDIPFDWSPDSKHIIFLMIDRRTIYSLDIASEEYISLGIDEVIEDMSWSHDGKKLLIHLQTRFIYMIF